LCTKNEKDNKESKIDADTKSKTNSSRFLVNELFKTSILKVGKEIFGDATTLPATVNKLPPEDVNALAQGALKMLQYHAVHQQGKQQGKQQRGSSTEQNGKNNYLLLEADCNEKDGTSNLDDHPCNSNDYESTSADDEEVNQSYDFNWRAVYGKKEYLPDIFNFHIDVTDPFIFECTLTKQINKLGRQINARNLGLK
jgi:hypothetical protein